MTRKHFKMLAAQLAARRELLTTAAQAAAWADDVARVADTCALTNPRFDRARFYAACGFERAEAKCA